MAGQAAKYVDQTLPPARRTMIVGPAPAGIGKVNDIYRFVFYVKDPDYEQLIRIKDGLESWMGEQQIRQRQPHISLQFDFDPMNTL